MECLDNPNDTEFTTVLARLVRWYDSGAFIDPDRDYLMRERDLGRTIMFYDILSLSEEQWDEVEKKVKDFPFISKEEHQQDVLDYFRLTCLTSDQVQEILMSHLRN